MGGFLNFILTRQFFVCVRGKGKRTLHTYFFFKLIFWVGLGWVGGGRDRSIRSGVRYSGLFFVFLFFGQWQRVGYCYVFHSQTKKDEIRKYSCRGKNLSKAKGPFLNMKAEAKLKADGVIALSSQTWRFRYIFYLPLIIYSLRLSIWFFYSVYS